MDLFDINTFWFFVRPPWYGCVFSKAWVKFNFIHFPELSIKPRSLHFSTIYVAIVLDTVSPCIQLTLKL